MKKKLAIRLTVLAVLIYLFAAFATLTLNPSKWSEGGRLMMCVCFIAGSYVIVMTTDEDE